MKAPQNLGESLMNVLVLGGGGREHALCWAIAKSPALRKLWCAPGNAGIAEVAECITLDILDPAVVVSTCQDMKVDLLVIGPEAPLETGVSNAARAAGINVFGPSKAAAMLETSKTFTKQVCDACHAPTAKYASFDNAEAAKTYIRAEGAPIVVKADGLAAGKGVVVASTEEEALGAVDHIFDGPGGGSVVIEEMMEGEEASFFVLTDGETIIPLAGAQDHKRAYDGDKGPNTGGMGAYSPAPVFTPELRARATEEIAKPILDEMRKRGTPYAGVLYVGLMLTTEGPKLVEINARFGDPECQCILPRLKTDLLPVLVACAKGDISGVSLDWSDETCLTVVMAAKGYPGSYESGTVIAGLDKANAVEGVTVFHAGTKQNEAKIVAAGGRVLGVTALGTDVATARTRAYEAVDSINWPGGFNRSDIAWRAL